MLSLLLELTSSAISRGLVNRKVRKYKQKHGKTASTKSKNKTENKNKIGWVAASVHNENVLEFKNRQLAVEFVNEHGGNKLWNVCKASDLNTNDD